MSASGGDSGGAKTGGPMDEVLAETSTQRSLAVGRRRLTRADLGRPTKPSASPWSGVSWSNLVASGGVLTAWPLARINPWVNA